MKQTLVIIALLALVTLSTGCAASGNTVQERRNSVPEMEEETLERFYREVTYAKRQLENADGYGVFSNGNVNLIIASAGTGYGVVVNNKTGERTFMRMAMGGLGLGFGVKDYRVVMLFPNREVLTRFLKDGWEFGGHADAAAKASDLGGEASVQGALGEIKTYSFTKAGLALQATLAGKKYWQDDSLN